MSDYSLSNSLEWLNSNMHRNYPIVDNTVVEANTPGVYLPSSFLVDLQLIVPYVEGLDASKFFISAVTRNADSFQITIGYLISEVGANVRMGFDCAVSSAIPVDTVFSGEPYMVRLAAITTDATYTSSTYTYGIPAGYEAMRNIRGLAHDGGAAVVLGRIRNEVGTELVVPGDAVLEVVLRILVRAVVLVGLLARHGAADDAAVDELRGHGHRGVAVVDRAARRHDVAGDAAADRGRRNQGTRRPAVADRDAETGICADQAAGHLTLAVDGDIRGAGGDGTLAGRSEQAAHVVAGRAGDRALDVDLFDHARLAARAAVAAQDAAALGAGRDGRIRELHVVALAVQHAEDACPVQKGRGPEI